MRLIDADALSSSIVKHKYIESFRVCDLGRVFTFEATKHDMYEKVITAPTIDAVPVVRCKDCKHTDQVTMPKGYVYCIRWDTVTDCDGFCHKGAKTDAEVQREQDV